MVERMPRDRYDTGACVFEARVERVGWAQGMEASLVSVVAGLVCGLLGGLPYGVALRVQRESREASILPILGAVCVSLVVLAVSVLVGYAAMRENLLVFACVLVVAFLAVTVVSVVVYGRKPRS